MGWWVRNENRLARSIRIRDQIGVQVDFDDVRNDKTMLAGGGKVKIHAAPPPVPSVNYAFEPLAASLGCATVRR